MMLGRQLAAVAITLALNMVGAFPARATPLLQLYVEGATYNYDHESWVFENPGEGIKLWVIGNVSGPGGKGTIYDVKLSVVYPDAEPAPTITLTGSTATDSYGFTDDSNPGNPGDPGQTVGDGSLPQLYDGRDLPSHGTYGSGWEWQEFSLGDFSLTDSPVADFIDSFPSAPSTTEGEGQINAYDINVTGKITDLHFDAYGYYVNGGGKEQAVFAPFSHDAGTGTNSVPEPATLALLGLGLAGLGFARKRLH